MLHKCKDGSSGHFVACVVIYAEDRICGANLPRRIEMILDKDLLCLAIVRIVEPERLRRNEVGAISNLALV